MKRVLMVTSAVFLMALFAGCVANPGMLTEKQQEEAIKKYPRTGLNILPDDGCGMITAKVFTRTILWPVTLGISEGVLLYERNSSFIRYAEDLEKAYYDSFLNKKKAVVVQKFGAPTRSCSDGNDGEICVYEQSYTTGGEGGLFGISYRQTPYRFHKDIREFYFDKKGVCYKWRFKNE